MTRGRRAWIAAACVAALSAAADAQRLTRKELRKLPHNHPAQCPHTGGDPELLAKMGILSTGGGFEFGATDTKATDELLPAARILWAETEHFEIGFALGDYRVGGSEKRKIMAELEELAEILPDLNTRTRSLDPWLRLYLTARRLEKVYDRFQEIARVEDSDFPGEGEQYVLGTKYMGLGPYMGMRGKYEVLVLPTQSQHTDFLSEHFGLHMRHTQRWHHIERGTLIVACHERQGDLRVDEALHAHLAFNVAANLLDGYKHYAYDLPIWTREGLAHALGREISRGYNSFDGSEGAAPLQSRKEDWEGEVRDLIAKNEAPRLGELMHLEAYGDLSLDQHFAIWSMTRFLMEEHPEGYACLLGTLTGLIDEAGYPDGSRMTDRHRDALRDCLGMTYLQFDETWRRWATGTLEEEPTEG